MKEKRTETGIKVSEGTSKGGSRLMLEGGSASIETKGNGKGE
jgi:hypothetical protein